MEMQKGYYAIIPANVRYDKDLSANAKLLYGEITALTNAEGYCWATNAYFAELYNVTKTSISLWIKQLLDKGYISSEIIYKEGTKEILNRYLRIINGGHEEKLNTPTQKKLKENNTCLNTTLNTTNNNLKNTKKEQKKSNSTELESEFELLWKKYPRKIGKTKALQSFIKARKTKKYTYEQIENGLNKYIEYLEMNGTDEQFIQHGSTWFNQENFLSEYESTQFQKKPQLSRFNQSMLKHMENPDDFLNLIGVESYEQGPNRKILDASEVKLS